MRIFTAEHAESAEKEKKKKKEKIKKEEPRRARIFHEETTKKNG